MLWIKLMLMTFLFFPTESQPSCFTNQPPDGLVGVNDCGITPDTLQLSCNISYQGNLEPVLEWKHGDETLFNADKNTSSSGIVSAIELTADKIRSTDFQCAVRYLNSSTRSKFICKPTTKVRVLGTLLVGLNRLIHS